MSDYNDEDISELEDNLSETEESSIILGEGLESLPPDTPVYQLRLHYSNETFFAAFPGDVLPPKTMVIVPTRYGQDLAQITCLFSGDAHSASIQAAGFARIERPASEEDLRKNAQNKIHEQSAFAICKEKIMNHKLDMKLITVHYLLDEPKILFFFTSENRVDFRELVKDLVSVFKTRIELRQIGVRDESRVLGGIGVCGRYYCCHAISDKLKPVSIKMAKDQNLSLNSMKISGPCGRLLCCLSYEHTFYSEQRRILPYEGSKISYDGTVWKVIEVNIIMGKVRMSCEDGRVIQLSTSAFEKVDNHWNVTDNPITHPC
ncbi:hypothetical protein FACS1894200_04490 [Spirochaetia bacterium]|nr:hypothetical protein FACS1894200_04490 [Spirochaetia bacterium]